MSTTTDLDGAMSAAADPIEEAWNQAKQRRQEIENEIQAFRDARMEEMARINGEIRRAERALRILRPDLFPPPQNGRGPGRPAATAGRRMSSSTRDQSIAEDLVIEAERFIRGWLQTHDTVRQVDLRNERSGWSSGKASMAFAVLRDEGILRKTRQVGNQKHFALTREGEQGKTMIKETTNA